MSFPIEEGNSFSYNSIPTEEEKDETISVEDDQIRRAQLRMQFHGTRKGDDETIKAYVNKLKSTADSLAAIGSPIADSDLVLQFLAGLPSEYLPIQKTISSKWPLPNFADACSLAYFRELILLHDHEEEKDETISVEDDQIRRTQLQMQFYGTRKGDDETIKAYVNKLKSTADSLAALGSLISDSDLVLQLLAGLPSEYLPLQNTISSKCPLPNFADACSMAYMQEGILLQEQNTSDPRVGGAAKLSDYCTVENFVDVMGTAGAVLGVVGAIVGAVGAVGTVVGAVGASRMIAVGAMSAVGTVSAVAGWKIWHQPSFYETKN